MRGHGPDKQEVQGTAYSGSERKSGLFSALRQINNLLDTPIADIGKKVDDFLNTPAADVASGAAAIGRRINDTLDTPVLDVDKAGRIASTAVRNAADKVYGSYKESALSYDVGAGVKRGLDKVYGSLHRPRRSRSQEPVAEARESKPRRSIGSYLKPVTAVAASALFVAGVGALSIIPYTGCATNSECSKPGKVTYEDRKAVRTVDRETVPLTIVEAGPVVEEPVAPAAKPKKPDYKPAEEPAEPVKPVAKPAVKKPAADTLPISLLPSEEPSKTTIDEAVKGELKLNAGTSARDYLRDIGFEPETSPAGKAQRAEIQAALGAERGLGYHLAPISEFKGDNRFNENAETHNWLIGYRLTDGTIVEGDRTPLTKPDVEALLAKYKDQYNTALEALKTAPEAPAKTEPPKAPKTKTKEEKVAPKTVEEKPADTGYTARGADKEEVTLPDKGVEDKVAEAGEKNGFLDFWRQFARPAPVLELTPEQTAMIDRSIGNIYENSGLFTVVSGDGRAPLHKYNGLVKSDGEVHGDVLTGIMQQIAGFGAEIRPASFDVSAGIRVYSKKVADELKRANPELTQAEVAAGIRWLIQEGHYDGQVIAGSAFALQEAVDAGAALDNGKGTYLGTHTGLDRNFKKPSKVFKPFRNLGHNLDAAATALAPGRPRRAMRR